MKTTAPESDPLFPEQYELHAAPAYRFAAMPGRLDRRAFIKKLGGGLVVLSFAGRVWAQGESGAPAAPAGQRRGGAGARGGRGGSQPQNLDAWVHIGADGTVTFFTGKTEVGQNIRTSLTQAVAEELAAPLASIRMMMADTDLTPFDQGTFGSLTTPQMAPVLRRAAATAREALLDLAATQLAVDRTTLTAADGKIMHAASSRSLGFGELTRGQQLVRTIAADTPLKPASAWKIAGTSVPKVDGRDFVTGRHRYASDIVRPDMVFGRVLRPAAYSATLASLDASAAEAMPGVKVVHDGEFVGVTAPTSFAATQALAALRAEWKTTPQISERELFTQLRGGAPAPEAGLTTAGDGSLTLQQTYTVAYIAHAPLEPRAAVAEWLDGKLTVWTGTQRPFGVRDELVQAFGLTPDRVRVIVPDTGSGYGGKHTGQAAIEAAKLAQAAGKPVKFVWTREDEFTWAYFRPAGVIDVASGVRADGTLTAWGFDNYNSGNAGIAGPYVIPGKREQFHQTHSPLPQGSYRSLAAAANHFARETHIDELARALKLDPLEFRRKNCADERLHAVVDAAATAFGWGAAKPAGHGHGVAVGIDKGGYVATFAEVAVDPARGRVTVLRAVQGFDCGAVVNPEHLKNQNEGAMVQGLGAALFEAIHFENGRIRNPHFASYRVPRFGDTPKVEVILMDRKDLPSAGAGETGIVGIAPAVGNAICDATGVRLRALPLVPNGLKG